MNVSITNDCNRRCEYCFQKDWYLSGKATPHNETTKEMSLETYKDLLVWYFKSEDKMGNDHLQLLGGEPMLHSQFFDIIEASFEWRIPSLSIISNISIDSEFFEKFIRIYGGNEKPISMLINSDYPESQRETFLRNYEMLVKSKIPFSISTTMLPNTKEVMKSAERILNLIRKYREVRGDLIPPVVRIAPMCPNQDGKDIDKFEFYNFSSDLAHFLNFIWQDGQCAVGLDCPINFCEMDKDSLREFLKMGVRIQSHRCDCEHGGPTDILVDNSVIWCSSADFIKVDNWKDFPTYRDCRNALCMEWKKYWMNTTIKCDYKNCDSFNPALCHGVCAAKNRFIENQINNGKRIRISSIEK